MKHTAANAANATTAALFLALLSLSLFSACQTAQLEASGAYIAAEAATAGILQKHPDYLPTAKLLVSDWQKYQLGTLTASDETTLLQSIVAATKGNLTPVQAALLDGATQQIIANQNVTAPTPLQGGAAAIITDVMNGVARETQIFQVPQ